MVVDGVFLLLLFFSISTLVFSFLCQQILNLNTHYRGKMSYKLVSELHGHTGPVRCLALGPKGELISGCQADAPNARTWRLLLPKQPGSKFGSAISHSHWVTATTSLPAGVNETYPAGVIVTGCMDSVVRIYDPSTHELLLSCEGHTKGVISLSWTAKNKLISGSWDGTARLWDLDLGGACLMELTGHENGVNVLGLPSGHILTSSTGESVNSKPANFQLRLWNPTNGKQLGPSRTDHDGPIRSLAAYSRNSCGFLSSSNDGSVRSYALASASMAIDRESQSMDDLEATSSATDDGDADIVSCAEDGSVCIWNSSTGSLVQSIPHPSCAWCVLPLDNGDFLTGTHDGIIRWFSCQPQLAEQDAAKTLTEGLEIQVTSMREKLQKGPSDEELAKCTLWSDRGSLGPKSEGTVMVFNKENKMIAAQMTNGSWIEIGEVTGKGKGDGGEVHGVVYDHVMPVEMDGPGGSTLTMKLGFNDAENPFIAAQRFIDQNEIGQHFLQQIADWILERSGRNQMPTLGAAPMAVVGDPTKVSASATTFSAPSAGNSGDGNFTGALTTYIVTTDSPPLDKLLNKISELYGNVSQIASIEAMLSILKDFSRYHVSEVTNLQITNLFSLLLSDSGSENLFPILDVARLAALHPHAATMMSKHQDIQKVYEKVLSLLSASAVCPKATLLTGLRFLMNSFRFDDLRAALLTPVLQTEVKNDYRLLGVLVCCHTHCNNSNKNIRQYISNISSNLALSLFSIPEFKSLMFNTTETLEKIMGLLQQQLSQETEVLEIIYKCTCSIGMMVTQGGVVLQTKIKELARDNAGVADIATILDIAQANFAGRSNDVTDRAIQSLRNCLR
eukprot:GSChrysophyteH1.ASY1.ANO1.1450.1 assembled CDS